VRVVRGAVLLHVLLRRLLLIAIHPLIVFVFTNDFVVSAILVDDTVVVDVVLFFLFPPTNEPMNDVNPHDGTTNDD
jgi:hypothetical protein